MAGARSRACGAAPLTAAGAARAQVTDTPGLLARPDADRNAMEHLTLACLAHLPTRVLFVLDLTAECGTSVARGPAPRKPQPR